MNTAQNILTLEQARAINAVGDAIESKRRAQQQCLDALSMIFALPPAEQEKHRHETLEILRGLMDLTNL